MPRPLHIIYITGLGDERIAAQRRIVGTWHWWGVKAEIVQMRWASDEAWPAKFNRLLNRIDEINGNGSDVALVGVSAGASVAINAFAARKDSLVGIVCIAGKVNRPEEVGREYARRNPAFLNSVQECQVALTRLTPEDRRRIMSRYAILDWFVTKKDSRIPGARNRVVPNIGHVPTIAVQTAIAAPIFLRFLKRLQSKHA